MSPTLDTDRHLQMVPDTLTAPPAHDELRLKRALTRAAGKPKSTFTPGPNLTTPGDGPLWEHDQRPAAPNPFSGLSAMAQEALLSAATCHGPPSGPISQDESQRTQQAPQGLMQPGLGSSPTLSCSPMSPPGVQLYKAHLTDVTVPTSTRP